MTTQTVQQATTAYVWAKVERHMASAAELIAKAHLQAAQIQAGVEPVK